MKLLRNLVQIKTEAAEDTFDGGIIHKPDNLKVAAPKGVIMATGPEVEEVKIGQYVVYGKHASQDFEEGSILILETDILCIIK